MATSIQHGGAKVVACVSSSGPGKVLELHHEAGVVVVNAPPAIAFSGKLDDAFDEEASAAVILAASGVHVGALVEAGQHTVLAAFGEDSAGKYSLIEDASTAGTLSAAA